MANKLPIPEKIKTMTSEEILLSLATVLNEELSKAYELLPKKENNQGTPDPEAKLKR